LDLENGLFPGNASFFFYRRPVREDVLLGNTGFVELALDDLADEKNFLRKFLWGKRLLPNQIGISQKGQKRPKEKREKVTHPSP
jgi:hypothetical protein